MADDEATARPPGTGRFRAAQNKVGAARNHFRQWRRSRPFWGGLLIILSGLEIVGSTQLSMGNLQIRIGMEGLQSVLIPVILIMAGILIWAMPVHRVFYAVISIAVALYSLIGINLGGFFIGMLLGILGGSLAIAWSPREPVDEPSPDEPPPGDEPTGELGEGPWDDLQQDTQVVRGGSIIPGMRDDRGTSSARLAVAGAVAGALIVAAVAPAGATGPLASQTGGAGCEPDPAPTQSPDPSTSPGTTQTPNPDPSSTPDPDADGGSEPGLIDSVISAVTGIFTSGEDTCDPTDDPTTEPTTEPTGAPTAEPTGDPNADADESSTEDEQSGETDELGLPDGFELPDDAELTTQQTLGSRDAPVVSASPARLTGSSIVMTGLVYEGNVDLPTADGPLTVMKFTMDKSVVADFSLAVDAMGETLLTTTTELTISGDVTFYTDRFVGRLLGFKFTFLPETPPPFTLPLMVFADPDIRLVAVEADVLTAPIMNQRQAG